MVSKENGTVSVSANDKNLRIFNLFHSALGAVYLFALFPLYFQIDALIGKNGLLPAAELLQTAYEDKGVIYSFLQFPSLFHLYPHDISLYVLITVGCLGGVMLLFNWHIHIAAWIAWISFLSITTVGGDFFIIIIDLFLAEVGFLSLFSTYYLQNNKHIPWLVVASFYVLNFKLWFCMGVNKFFLPDEVWTSFTFFDYFFHAQPMPTPLATVFEYSSELLKKLAIAALFVGEIIIPFFVFGGRRCRIVAFVNFVAISILIQLNGNYGYFNVLSVVVAIPLLSSTNFFKTQRLGFKKLFSFKHASLASKILSLHILWQMLYCVWVFNPKPHASQNHFNFIFHNVKSNSKNVNAVLQPLKWIECWRLCNPYGVFKSIPKFHGEIRFSGSIDGKTWRYYKFRYLPSCLTDYLGFYAPYYPRLDHLMFYETLNAQNYKWNVLNKYNNNKNAWIANFIRSLFNNNKCVGRLINENPFSESSPPAILKAELFQLSFCKKTNCKWSCNKKVAERIFKIDDKDYKMPIFTNKEIELVQCN